MLIDYDMQMKTLANDVNLVRNYNLISKHTRIFIISSPHSTNHLCWKVIVLASFISFFCRFRSFLSNFFFRQLTMHDDILQTEHKEKKLVFYYAFGSRFSRERNWMAELNFYARNLWSNITNIIFAIETVTSYCIATMNKSDDVLTMGEILFSFVTTFFFRKKKHFFANGITEILCHKQIWSVNLIQLLSSVLSVVWLQSTNKKMTGLR